MKIATYMPNMKAYPLSRALTFGIRPQHKKVNLSSKERKGEDTTLEFLDFRSILLLLSPFALIQNAQIDVRGIRTDYVLLRLSIAHVTRIIQVRKSPS